MKNFLTCLALSMALVPMYAQGKTDAYSPDIPGQPLIFHTSTPSISTAEQKLFQGLSRKDKHALFEVTTMSIRLSEGILGLVGTLYLPTNTYQKNRVASLYSRDINASISSLYQTFLTLKGPQSQELADLVLQTLRSFTEITNEMLSDTVNNSNNAEFHQDYLQMQIDVINNFKSGIANLFPGCHESPFEAEAISALEGLVSNVSLYMTNLDGLVNESQAGPRNMVFARQQLSLNLTAFIQSTFALQITKH